MPKKRSSEHRNRAARAGAAAACAAALAATTTGCAALAAQPLPDDGRPVVLATFTVIADMAREVAGDRARVESLTKPGAEVHGYEPTPSDLQRAVRADLVLVNGLGLEGWTSRFTDRVRAPQVVLTQDVDVLVIAEGAAAGEEDPHAWMSPVQAQHYVRAIAAALSELDPAGAPEYAERARAYGERVAAVGQELAAALAALPPEQRALVTCEGAFGYLARDAGLSARYLWPVNSDADATPRRIAAVVEFVERGDVPAVFCESTVSDRVQQRVAAETGARLGGTLYVDSLSAPGGPVPTYLDLLRHDARVVVEGLTGRAGPAGAASGEAAAEAAAGAGAAA
ncbi:metal ABC transporter substrate-binding protein [Quadrisphaera sp. DSM 44207]|uniref:metal ABC transporter substrate-binding protein n=1 Tax=Quadrisphaera sp. DSM 44207 TaxID=1881057 RepID=UPI000888E5E4|nr:metal ABC transporter substrate-binding protein [Quadrisphaera sp. DSM 44207]SDQ69089.1 manganese transport system substrate-binding protein [Quadrisphaera sp. DSM 44207]